MSIKPPILSKPLQTYSVNSSMHMGLQVRRKEKSMKMYFTLEVVERLKEKKTRIRTHVWYQEEILLI